MIVEVVNESGYEQAIEGIGYSYGVSDFNRLEKVAKTLCNKEGGHNKFLESIVVWIRIVAPRYWWSQADTYRASVTKQSESTMHTLCRRAVVEEDFVAGVSKETIDNLNKLISVYKEIPNEDVFNKNKLFEQIKCNLPEGYLQKRMVCTNYKTLRNIIRQRKDHKLVEWKEFISVVISSVEHPEFLCVN